MLLLYECIPRRAPGARVAAIISCFQSLVELENWPDILAGVSRVDRAALIRRLGWLNLLNPYRPEGEYHLDLSCADNRVVAMLLGKLCSRNPMHLWKDTKYIAPTEHEGWAHANSMGWADSYRWAAYDELTQQGSFPKGHLSFRYVIDTAAPTSIKKKRNVGFTMRAAGGDATNTKNTGNATEKKEIQMGDLMKLVLLGGERMFWGPNYESGV